MAEFRLRMATKEDVPAMLAIYTPYVLESTASFEYEPPDLEEFTARFAAGAGIFPWLVCEDADGVFGYACTHRMAQRKGYDWAAETTVYIAMQRRQSGAGRALYAALESLMKEMGYRCLYGIVTHPNPGSEAFHEKMGYIREGLLTVAGYKHGRTLGVAYYAKRLCPIVDEPPPPPPLRFAQLPPAFVQQALQAAVQGGTEDDQ